MRYRVNVKDALSDRMAESLGATEVVRNGGDTWLTVDVRDQAALLGLVDRLSDLGLQLIAIQPVDRAFDGITPGE